jgi:pyruvyltransferase
MFLLESIKIKICHFYNKKILRKRIDRGIFYTGSRANIGDSMVPWLVEKVSGVNIPYSNPLSCNGPHLFTIGSILQYSDKDCTVWGSGFISENSKIRTNSKNLEVLAVRGPLTAKKLKLECDIDVKVFGDPALLTPLYIKNSVNKSNKIGMIPHYVDKSFIPSNYYKDNGIKFIDVETDDILDFCNLVRSCEIIISSSLHGIIIAEAFGIPAVWLKVGERIYGNEFKFHDYYLSTDREYNPTTFEDLDLVNLKACKTITPEKLRKIQSELINAFPKEYC